MSSVAPALRRARGSTKPIARGLKRRPWRDVYHFFLTASWPAMFGAFVGSYLTLNVLFAGLYLLDPGGITQARPGSFFDAFFFSVQTLATIGYGNMSPHSFYAHVLVTFEALVGVLSLAIATGLLFAKFSHPTARILFSQSAVVSRRDGVPSLMFRMANERNGDIVEAQLSVFLARDEVTLEGEKVRRFYDLPLVRQRNAVFALTWTAVHPLRAESPLCGTTNQSLDAEKAELVVSFVGLDAVTLQSVHARTSYIASEIMFGARLSDILSVGADGQNMIDYTRFHLVEPAA